MQFALFCFRYLISSIEGTERMIYSWAPTSQTPVLNTDYFRSAVRDFSKSCFVLSVVVFFYLVALFFVFTLTEYLMHAFFLSREH